MRKILLAAVAIAVGLGADLTSGSPTGAPADFARLALTTAQAQPIRRETRRVARRTARRTAYRTTLPAGCIRRGAYYYCGGIYYNPVLQDGKTVYVVVNP